MAAGTASPSAGVAELDAWLRTSVFQGADFSFPDNGAGKRGRFSVCCRLQSAAKLGANGAAPATNGATPGIGGAADAQHAYVLKRSVLSEMEPRSGEKWACDVLSFRAEFAVYAFLQRVSAGSGGIAGGGVADEREKLWPAVHALLLDGFEPFVGASGAEKAFLPAPGSKMAMVLEDLEAVGYEQRGELSAAELRASAVLLAGFHAATLPLVAAGPGASGSSGVWPLGSFFTKDKRGGPANFAREVAAMEARWAAFLANWPELSGEAERAMGARLAKHAGVIADEVCALPRSVLVHGDGKTANMFFHREAFGVAVAAVAAGGEAEAFRSERVGSTSAPVRWIDFQWAGFGSPLMDIVYLVVSSARICGEERPPTTDAEVAGLLRLYYSALRRGAAAVSSGSAEALGDDVAMPSDGNTEAEGWLAERVREYKLVFLDYARVVVSYMWDGKFDPALVEQRGNSINFCIHNRSAPHVAWLARTVLRYLDDLAMT